MHMKGEPMAGKENREIKNSAFVDLFYEDESAEANEIALFNAIHGDSPIFLNSLSITKATLAI